MHDDFQSEVVERSAFVGLFLLIKDMFVAVVSRGVSLRYRFDPDSQQHHFGFSVAHDPDNPRGSRHYHPDDPRYEGEYHHEYYQ